MELLLCIFVGFMAATLYSRQKLQHYEDELNKKLDECEKEYRQRERDLHNFYRCRLYSSSGQTFPENSPMKDECVPSRDEYPFVRTSNLYDFAKSDERPFEV